MSKQAIVLIRAHRVDEGLFTHLAYLRQKTSADVRILLHDEDRRYPDDEDFISFSRSSVERLGMSTFDDNQWAWFMGDCALYTVLHKFPDCEQFVMVDYDCKINFDLEKFLIEYCDGTDFIAQYAGDASTDWEWYAAAAKWFSNVKCSFFPLVYASRRLLEQGVERRVLISDRWRLTSPRPESNRDFMVNCEAFLPSLCSELGYAMSRLENTVPNWDLRYFTGFRVLPWDSKRFDAIAALHPCFPNSQIRSYYRNVLENPFVSQQSKDITTADFQKAIEAGEI